MKELIKDHVYGINGKEGLIGTVVSLLKSGKDVCVDSSYHIGNGNYVVAYYNDSEDSVVTAVEEQVEVAVEAPQEDPEDVKHPDWEMVKGFIKDTEDGAAKEKLISYAESFGIPRDKFDKRKVYSKLVATFRGYHREMSKVQ